MNSKIILSVAIALIPATLAIAPSAFAERPPWVEVNRISHAGSGCAAGTVYENISADGTALGLYMDDFTAETGPGVSLRESRKNCQLNIDLDYPQGWQFAVWSMDFKGYVSLERRVTGTVMTTYYFQGQRQSVSLRSDFNGPIDQDYHVRDQLGVSSMVWSPCGGGRSLNVNVQVRLNNRSNRQGSGLMTLDFDGRLISGMNLQWRRCSY